MLRRTKRISHFDKEYGVWITSEDEGIHIIHAIKPPRKYIKGNKIGEPKVDAPKRIAFDFLISTDNKEEEKDVSIEIGIKKEDFNVHEDPFDPKTRDNVIQNILNIFDYDGTKWNMVPAGNLIRKTFDPPKVINGTTYFGSITANIKVKGDPPIAVGR